MPPPDQSYIVIELGLRRSTIVDLATAAETAALTIDELTEAIDEFGVFDDGHIVVADYAAPDSMRPVPPPAPRGLRDGR